MSPDPAALPDPQIIGPLERRPALPADHTEAVFAHQRFGHRLPALRAIKHRGLVLFHLLIIASLSGCLRFNTDEPSIGEAFVVPASLQLLEEIGPRGRVTATLQHGDKVDILARNRRFAKVRGPHGAVGWTDGRQLLSSQGMVIFRQQSEQARHLPPQGSAHAAGELNVHITPYRGSPSFYQLRDGDTVTLAARSMMPRINYVPPDQQSGQLVTADTIRDDWSLVCLPDRRCGWVLTNMLMPDLPDEVIQFAEGHRITAFFKLGQVSGSDGKTHPTYLWTTSTAPPDQFQFDSFRVFMWSVARDRYEAIHTERNLRGYHPARVEGGRIRLTYAPQNVPEFELKTFELRGRKLALLAHEPWTPPQQLKRTYDVSGLPDDPAEQPGVWSRLTAWFRSLKK